MEKKPRRSFLWWWYVLVALSAIVWATFTILALVGHGR